jgi:hypothetical protein
VLWKHDLQGSKGYAKASCKCGVLTEDERYH